jgi:hypothetical protein
VLIWGVGGGREARVARVDLERARLVHKTAYAERRLTVYLTGTEPRLFGILEARRLAIVHGQCAAGIDYDKYPAAYESSGKRIRVRIAEPQLLDCGVTSIQLADAGGLVPASTDLSNRLFDEAYKEIRRRALEEGMLEAARQSAREKTELELRRMGFEEVAVDFVAAPE